MHHPVILFILHLPPPVHGAAMVGQYIHESELINGTFECHYINLTTAKSLKDIGKVGIRKFIVFAKLLKRIRETVRRFKPDLVYITPNACGSAFYKDFVVVQMLKCLRCKVVVHYHNKGVSTRQDRVLDDMMYRRFFNGVKVILLAESLYKDIEKYVRREDVYICPNGIPKTLADEPVVERNNKIPHLLFLSNLLESKGVFVLLDACRILKDNGYSFICDFVGSETAEIDAQRFAHEIDCLELNKIAVYHGGKYGEDKEFFWQYADVFIFPTYYCNECFPLVLLEAMQHGVACISTSEGGIPDIVKNAETGFVVERQSSEQLAEKIAWLIDNKDMRTQMGNLGYEKFCTEFALNVFEKRMCEILELLA